MVDLGMTQDEFEDTTPRLLLDALRRLREREEGARMLADFQAGTVAAAFFNAQRTKKDDKVWTAADFFTSLREDEDEKAEVGAAVAALKAIARSHKERA